MGRPKRLYPLGKYRLRTPKEVDKDNAYPVELAYTWNRQIIRKTTNVFVKVADWKDVYKRQELHHPMFDLFDMSCLRTGIMAGSLCPVELMKQVEEKMYMKVTLSLIHI